MTTHADRVGTFDEGVDRARVLDARGWDLYLLSVPVLSPFVRGIAGMPAAVPDLVSVAALLVFAIVLLTRRIPLELPLLWPALVAATGSMFAVMSAESVSASALALAQDAYLFVWTAALVALLRRRGEMLAARRATAAVALGVALGALYEAWTHGAHSLGSLFSPTGHRSYGSFGNANMSAEFQMLGVFTVLGLERGLPRWFSRAAMVLLFAGILTAKSNGTLIALATGLTVWALWRTHARGVPARRLAGALALAAVAIVLPAWLLSETGLGGEWLEKIREKSLLARMSHSSDVRGRIWERLEERLVEQPLGIGPGNSSVGFVEIGEAERPGGLDAKEAHNDYLGYAVERGPLGVLGLLAGLVAIVTRLARGRRALEARTGDAGRAIAIQAAGLGAVAGLLVQSTVIEQLHFRHLWWWVAWMWAATGPVQVASAARAAISRRPAVAGPPDSAANPAPGGAPA